MSKSYRLSGADHFFIFDKMLPGNKQKSIVHILESLFFMHYTDIVLAFTNQEL